MMEEKIVFETEDGNVEFFVLEQTMLRGINYILVTDDRNSEEGDFLILKETGGEGDNELMAVVSVFDELLEDIDLEV